MQKNTLPFAGDALINRRTVVAMPSPILGSLRWPDRPVLPEGNPCWTFMVENGPEQYAVAVGHVENGRPHPFEVWVLANEQPRCLGATAKTLSVDMRTQDRVWLNMKLDALTRVIDGFCIDLQLGSTVFRTSSNSAALARVVQYRLEHLGVAVPEAGEATPMVNALFEMHGSDYEGTLSWTANINNPSSGDDFTLFLPEIEVDGGHRPIAVRLSGRYPRDLDGLAALLTMDMAIVDVGWIGMKLRKLLDYEEPMGSFFAKTPNTGISERYPSIVAYMAHLIIHRFATLGLLTQAGFPVVEMGVMVRSTGGLNDISQAAA